MIARCRWILLAGFLLGLSILPGRGQDAPPPAPVPEGVEVQARGPVHEAFAGPTSAPVATPAVAKKPPAPIEELPPAEKPNGNMIWIGGYWAYDDDRKDFLWVSGVWRAAPPEKQWVAGYWREQGADWQWVPGFWAKAARQGQQQAQQVTYLPPPPAAPAVASPGNAPTPESFYIPGTWVWTGSAYAYRAGYWARRQANYVWVADHYRWTPSGYVYVPGYWDFTLRDRGLLYAPVIISPSVVTVGFTYTPYYAVRDTVVVDALFIRPATCHYYFGDYYEPCYRRMGYESCVVYSRRNYASIIVYETYERRRDPNWVSLQINVYNDRCAGRAVCPPRTLVQQNTFINNTTINRTTVINNNITMIAPPSQVAQAKSVTMVAIDNGTRQQARIQAQSVQQVGLQRSRSELPLPPGAPRQARVASFSVPAQQAVKPGMVAAQPAARPNGPMRLAPATAAVTHPSNVRPGVAAVGSTGTVRPAGVQPISRGQPTPAARPGMIPPGMGHPQQPAPIRPGMVRPAMGQPQRPAPKRPPDRKDSERR